MVMVGHSKRLAQPLTPRQKRGMAISLVVVLLAVLGATVYAVVNQNSGSFGASHDGCVNLTVASSLGGALIHQCVSAARTFCRHAQTHTDTLSLQARPQCVLAGFPPARASG